MYAQKFADGPRFRPASLGAAIAINGAFIAALILANPNIIPTIKRDRTQIFDVPITEPTPEPTHEVLKVKPQPQPTSTVVTPDPIIKSVEVTPNTVKGETIITEPLTPGTGTGTTPGTYQTDLPIIPKFIGAREDPRFARDLQPPYPDFERDAGREGVVKVRILIGIDGRVKQAERIDGRDSFARATIAQALAKWRFQPATRGGVPEESWKVMTVRFTLNE